MSSRLPPEPPRVGATLAGLRQARALSLDELSRQAGVSKSILSQIERNQANPTVAVVWRLANALGVTMAELLSGIGIRYPARSRGEHAWTGRRMPDLDCGGARIYEELRDGRFLLVTREAIRNAVIHGAPTHVSVHLGFTPGAIHLTVADDGCGIEASECLASQGHFGILGMRERMEQIGGALEVSGKPGEGTTVTALLPLSC